MTPELNLGIAFLMVIPLVMAFLPLTLKDRANRWANVIMGIVFAAASLFDPIGYVTGPPTPLMPLMPLMLY